MEGLLQGERIVTAVTWIADAQGGMAMGNCVVRPVDIVSALEAAGLLAEPVPVTSPLRQVTAAFDPTRPLPICWDSRLLPAQGARESARCVFVARTGQRFDGHTLVDTVLGEGHLFLGERPKLLRHGTPHASHPFLLQVTSSEAALRLLLALATGIGPEDFQSIAVTGTSGKTSVTQIAGYLLAQLTARPVVRIGTLGIQLGAEAEEGAYPTMPDYPGFMQALAQARARGMAHLVFEATSHGLLECRLGDWRVDVGVFTNFSQDHLDYHQTMTAYQEAKGLLFARHLKTGGTAILNAADAAWESFLRRLPAGQAHVIGFGPAEQQAAFFQAASGHGRSVAYMHMAACESDVRGIRGRWRLSTPTGVLAEAAYACRLLGDFQHANLTAAAAAVYALCAPEPAPAPLLARLAALAADVPGIPGRLELANGAGEAGPTVLVDYAHKPDALEKVLLTLQTLRRGTAKLICVFGCGGDRDRGKRPIMGAAAARLADEVVVTSDNPRTEQPEAIMDDIVAGIPATIPFVREADRRRAVATVIANASQDDIVVLAGKGHEDYQIIGTTKYHLSDLEEARKALALRWRHHTPKE